jgi:hypothetical protein
MNVDAAFSHHLGKSAIGVVARNDQGTVLAGVGSPICTCNNVEKAN